MAETIVTALVGLVGVLLGVVASDWLRRRQVSDREALVLWRVAFDRQAFKGRYVWHSDVERFRRAIDVTIKAVDTGVLCDGSGNDLKRGKAKSQLRSSEWRTKMDDVQARLHRISNIIPKDKVPPDPDTIAALDSERDEVVKILNSIWQHAHVPPMQMPTSYRTYDEAFKSP